MSKSIKIDNDIYQHLDNFRGKGQTFSQAIQKLVTAAYLAEIIADELQGRPLAHTSVYLNLEHLSRTHKIRNGGE